MWVGEVKGKIGGDGLEKTYTIYICMYIYIYIYIYIYMKLSINFLYVKNEGPGEFMEIDRQLLRIGKHTKNRI